MADLTNAKATLKVLAGLVTFGEAIIKNGKSFSADLGPAKDLFVLIYENGSTAQSGLSEFKDLAPADIEALAEELVADLSLESQKLNDIITAAVNCVAPCVTLWNEGKDLLAAIKEPSVAVTPASTATVTGTVTPAGTPA